MGLSFYVCVCARGRVGGGYLLSSKYMEYRKAHRKTHPRGHWILINQRPPKRGEILGVFSHRHLRVCRQVHGHCHAGFLIFFYNEKVITYT